MAADEAAKAADVAAVLVSAGNSADESAQSLLNFYYCAEKVANELSEQSEKAQESLELIREQAEAGDQ